MQYIENEKFRLGAREVGAELRSFVDKRGEEEYEYLWQGGEIWDGCSPLLFPVVGRLREDTYYLSGGEYHLQKHGFAKKSVFELESMEQESMTFLLKDRAETLQGYPFPFELRMHFALTEDGFRMEHRVKNTGPETMYFSIGAHPGFQCEMGDRIVMDACETAAAFRLDADALRGKETLPVFDHSREITITPTIFAEDALIFDGLQSKGASLIRKNGRNVHVDFGGAPCLGIWAKPGAPYVCIEPWYGIDDAWDAEQQFVKKERIQALDPGAEFVFTVTVAV